MVLDGVRFWLIIRFFVFVRVFVLGIREGIGGWRDTVFVFGSVFKGIGEVSRCIEKLNIRISGNK